MNSITITKVIELTWQISGYDCYCFGKDKKLYNAKTGREIKKTLNGKSIGYWLGKKFYSLNRLKPMLVRPKNYRVPF